MDGKEIRAVGELIGGAVGGAGTLVREMHEAVSRRPFRALGIMGAPVRLIHDGISAAAYGAVAGALRAPPRVAAALIARATPPAAPSLSDSVRGSIAAGVLNGAIGDVLVQEGSPLALGMSLRRERAAVPTTPADLARAYPDATSRLAVFVHGLCETDEAWHLSSPSYGSRLREDLGWTPLYLRYNTGLHISENGHRLSDVLDEVVAGWPVPVEEIVLVGHSMGGLVARSACHYGHRDGARWTRTVRHLFCLGSPHLGAPLEKVANVAGTALARLPETRPFAKLVNGRSVGIKDLRFGSCVEEDWCDCDPDEFLKDRCREVPFLEDATYYFVGATLGREIDSPVSSLVGDLLVRFPSASGRGRRRKIPFAIEHGHHVGGANHFQLLNHPDVYEQIRAWLGPGQRALAR